MLCVISSSFCCIYLFIFLIHSSTNVLWVPILYYFLSHWDIMRNKTKHKQMNKQQKYPCSLSWRILEYDGKDTGKQIYTTKQTDMNFDKISGDISHSMSLGPCQKDSLMFTECCFSIHPIWGCTHGCQIIPQNGAWIWNE